jgi:hypothetical protein
MLYNLIIEKKKKESGSKRVWTIDLATVTYAQLGGIDKQLGFLFVFSFFYYKTWNMGEKHHRYVMFTVNYNNKIIVFPLIKKNQMN